MTWNKYIGGEFDIPIEFMKTGNESGGFVFSSGRSAYRTILRDLRSNGYNKIWLPEYICDSVRVATEFELFEIYTYHLDSSLNIKNESMSMIIKEASIPILLVDYFGLIDLSPIVSMLKENEIIIILDTVQAYFKSLNLSVDYSFNSVRKFLPIPEGAQAFKFGKPLPAPCQTLLFGQIKTIAGFIKNISIQFQLDDNVYLTLFEAAEKLIDETPGIFSATLLYNYLFSKIDIESMRKKRANNYKQAYIELKDNAITPLFEEVHENIAPLAVPLLIENRDEIRKILMRKKIYLPVHWPCHGKTGLSNFFSEHEISLVIDHRYSESDISRMIDCLAQAKPKIIHYVD